jgi:hypothetical protein
MKKVIWLVALLVVLARPASAQMFDKTGTKVNGTLDVLRCDELDKFDAGAPDAADLKVLGTYGLGYLNGMVTGVISVLEASGGPESLAFKKRIQESYHNFPLSIGIVDANIRALCNTGKYPKVQDTLSVVFANATAAAVTK